MVRTRLRRVCGAALPRTKKALGPEAFEAAFVSWLAEAPPSTRFFREVPAQFAAHLAPRLEAREEGWLPDLARYELAEWTVKSADDADLPPLAPEFGFERPPVVSPALTLLEVGWTVPRKKAKRYEPTPLHLCIYRDPESFQAVTMELNELARDLLRAWIPGDRTMTEAVQAVAQARGTAIDARFIDGLSSLLEDFLGRGILLGSRA